MIETVPDLPAVLLTYQQKLLRASATYPVVICPKSRRIGMTWGIASGAVLDSATSKADRGMDTFYIGFNLDMAREFIDTCAMWAKAFSYVASEVEEYVFKDIDENNETKEIMAFRIKFDSGFEISALTSRPRSLRGRQGSIIIDEAAFHDDLKELMKAALAMLIWGGKVLVISTHDGVNNPFNEYIQEARAGRNNYYVMQVDFDQALNEGLYKRICLTTKTNWSPEAEAQFRSEIIGFYGEGADEELFCIPKNSSGAFISSLLVESRMIDVPVVRFDCNAEFVFLPEYERQRLVEDWCASELKPLLDALDPKLNSYLGEDFGRSGDLSVLWPLQVEQSLSRHTPFTVEMRNVSFKQQEQIVWYIIDRMPRFCAGAFDARGNGQQLAEVTMQRYGQDRIFTVMTSRAWYLEALPKYKAALEDGKMDLPRDADILNDHRLAVMQAGVPQIPETRKKGADGGKRHGDSLVAAAMAFWATLQTVMAFGYEPIGQPRRSNTMGPPVHDDDSRKGKDTFGNNKGAW